MTIKENKSYLVSLYSSENFKDPSDVKPLEHFKKCDNIKFINKFISNYSNQYFKAIVSFEIIKRNHKVIKTNITIKNICFKSDLDVSVSSQTDEYHYLYDISCSSSSDSDSSCSISSISSIINKKIKKDITINIINFFKSNAILVDFKTGDIILDVTKYSNCNETIFSSAKLIAKYIYVSKSSSSSSSSSSNCSTISSSNCNIVSKKIFKLITISFILLFILILLLKFSKNKKFDKIKNFIKKSYFNKNHNLI